MASILTIIDTYIKIGNGMVHPLKVLRLGLGQDVASVDLGPAPR